jgi:hypothetical protein
MTLGTVWICPTTNCHTNRRGTYSTGWSTFNPHLLSGFSFLHTREYQLSGATVLVHRCTTIRQVGRRVVIVSNGSGFGPQKWIGSVPDLPNTPTHLLLAGQTWTSARQPGGFTFSWLEPSVPISGSAFRVSHLFSNSDLLLLIVKYWHWCVTVHFQCISPLDAQNTHTYVTNHILKIRVNRVWVIFSLTSSVIWVVLDPKHPYGRLLHPPQTAMYGIF